MLVNMSVLKNRKSSNASFRNNGTFASINGFAAAFNGIFASNFIYDSPASVSTP